MPVNLLRRGIEHAYFGAEIHDEGTNEFQLVDIHGRGKKVYVDDKPATSPPSRSRTRARKRCAR